MKIGIVCFPTYGGSGAVAGELAKGLAQRGHAIHVISYDLPFRLKSFTRNIVFHVVDTLRYSAFPSPPYVLSLASRIIEICNDHPLDVLHLHYAIPHASSGFLAKCILREKSPVLITTLHGTDITLVGSHPSFYPITRFSIEESDGITCVSNYLRETTLKVFHIEREIEVIHNFIDINIFSPRPARDLKDTFGIKGEKVLMHISNFRPVKRVIDVIKTFSLIEKEVSSKLILIGDGEDRPEVMKLAWEMNLRDGIIFLGKQDNVEDLIPMADVFLFPSADESFGLAALEALSSGVPVVGSAAGGLPEVVEHGVCGFLHPVGSVKEMADSAISLLTNEGRLGEFRENARLRAVQKFNEKDIVPQYEDYYRKILNAKARL